MAKLPPTQGHLALITTRPTSVSTRACGGPISNYSGSHAPPSLRIPSPPPSPQRPVHPVLDLHLPPDAARRASTPGPAAASAAASACPSRSTSARSSAGERMLRDFTPGTPAFRIHLYMMIYVAPRAGPDHGKDTCVVTCLWNVSFGPRRPTIFSFSAVHAATAPKTRPTNSLRPPPPSRSSGSTVPPPFLHTIFFQKVGLLLVLRPQRPPHDGRGGRHANGGATCEL